MKLSIIVINYNTKDLTLKCIDSIFKEYKKEIENGSFELILIDNASPDGSGKKLLDLFKNKNGITFIESKENLGFGGGNNKAAKIARGEYLLFLNSDTEVLDGGLLGMIEFLGKNERTGILGARLENIDGSNQKSAVKFYNLPNLFLMLLGFERFGLLRTSPAKISRVDWVSGASLMIRNDLFEKLGGFDKNLFMYIEDMELCYRAQKANFDVFFYPNIKIVHKELGSGNKTFAILNIYKGILYFYKTHKSVFQYNIARFILRSKAVVLKNVGILTGNKYFIKTYGEALEIL